MDLNRIVNLAQQQLNQHRNDANNRRNLVRDSFSRQRGLVQGQAENAARIALARRGIDVNSPYGQRSLQDMLGTRYDNLAAQESAALSNIAEPGLNLGAITSLMTGMANIEMQRERLRMQQEDRDQAQNDRDQGLAAAQEAERLRQYMERISPRPATPSNSRSMIRSSGYSGGGGAGARIIGDPNPPSSPQRSIFAPTDDQMAQQEAARQRRMAWNASQGPSQVAAAASGGPGPTYVPGMEAGASLGNSSVMSSPPSGLQGNSTQALPWYRGIFS